MPEHKILRTLKSSFRIDDQNDEVKLSNTAGAKLEFTSNAVIDNAGAKVTVGQAGVVSEHAGATLAVGNAAVSANNGALEVR